MATTYNSLKGGRSKIVEYSNTWTGDNSLSVTPGHPFILHNVTVHYDASITNNCTVTLDAQAGSNYDTVLATANNAGGETDNFFIFGPGNLFVQGNIIKVACNVGANNAYCTITVEELIGTQ